MIWTIVVILIILWFFGFTVVHMGALVHLLLVVALLALIYRLITDNRVQ